MLIPEVAPSPPSDDAGEYRDFFDAVPSGQFILDGGHRIRQMNPAAVLLLRAGDGELQGHRFSELFAPRSRSEIDRAFVLMDSDPAAGFRRLTAEALSTDGSPFLVEVTVIRLSGRTDDAFGAVLRDLRERPAAPNLAEPVADPRTVRGYSLGELLMANRLRDLV